VKEVEHHATKPMNSGPAYNCTSYKRSGAGVDFNAQTVAPQSTAAVINQHAASLRLRAAVPTKLVGHSDKLLAILAGRRLIKVSAA
jgi:hypothetical protein